MFDFLKNPFKRKKEVHARKSAEAEKEDLKAVKKEAKPEKKEEKKEAQKEKPSPAKKGEYHFEKGYRVLLKPRASEKTASRGTYETYVFEVARNTNKVEIKKAFWRLYGVKPISVNMVAMPARTKRFGRTIGTQSAWKKAYIRVPKGSSVNVYEGV
jgi:large subunit ribosomal protein L23